MPLQELSPPPPITGYSALGATLAGAGQDYLQRSRQLQDVASQRAWLEKEGDKTRAEKLQDEQTLMSARLKNEIALEQQRNRDAGIQVLINEGYLDGSQRDNASAVANAYKRAQADGVTKMYQELLTTPDDNGRPLLTTDDAHDPAKVQAAKDRFGAMKAKMLQFQMTQPGNAQATVDSLSQQLAQHQARIAQISAKLDEPAKQYAFSNPQVQALAVQLAEQAKPGSGRNREAVGQMLPIAQKQLNDQATLQHMQDVQAATRQLEGERYAEASITQALDHAMQTGKVFPSKGAGLTPTMLQTPAPPVAPKVASAQDIAAAIQSAVGGKSVPALGSPVALTPIDNPDNNATIAGGNAEIQRVMAGRAQSQLNAAIDEGRQIDAALSDAQQRAAQGAQASPSLFPGAAMTTALSRNADPIGAAQQTADLLKRKAENAARVKALQSQLIGPQASAVTPAAINTPTASTPTIGAAQGTPAWWQSTTPDL